MGGPGAGAVTGGKTDRQTDRQTDRHSKIGLDVWSKREQTPTHNRRGRTQHHSHVQSTCF
eukprot:452315-Rhodomonas_salina.1